MQHPAAILRRGRQRPGYVCEGRLHGLPEPAQAGFVA
jgi:hypothetical protein